MSEFFLSALGDVRLGLFIAWIASATCKILFQMVTDGWRRQSILIGHVFRVTIYNL
jgi:hypothetical protein